MSAFHTNQEDKDTRGDMGPIHGHLDKPSDKDAGQLADEILDWLCTVGEADFSDEDADKLDRMLDQLEAMHPTDEEIEAIDVEESLKQFHIKYATLFDETAPVSALRVADTAARVPDLEMEPTASKRKRPRSPRFPIKAAAIIAVALICSSAFAQAYGVNIWGTIARITSETFHFEKVETPYAEVTVYPIAEGETAYYDSLQDATEALGITAPLAPMWVPERLGVPEIYVEYKASGIYIYADYMTEEDFLSIRFNESSRATQRIVEKDFSPDITHVRRGIDHHIVADQSLVKVAWSNGTFECHMSGNITEEEALKIIDSIYEERD